MRRNALREIDCVPDCFLTIGSHREPNRITKVGEDSWDVHLMSKGIGWFWWDNIDDATALRWWRESETAAEVIE